MTLNSFSIRVMSYTNFTEYYKYLESSNITIFNAKDYLTFISEVLVLTNE
jgi:hypothetical protein